MAAQAQPEVVHEFEVDGRGTLRTCLTEFRGRRYMDLRLWVGSAPGGELIATRKGLSLPTEYLDELQAAVGVLAHEVRPDDRRVA